MPRQRKVPCDINTTKEHYDSMLWCMRNKIFVKPFPTPTGVRLEICVKKRSTVSPETYENCEAQQKIWDIYVKLREKYQIKS
jgi:hypothetical protein|tara:strand:- start:1209 stop:1454 length:246 start_codon:yes stop_codon:yes gene_type:complete